MPLLTVSNLTKLYGPDQILDSVGFQLERGEHTALVGSNGSGKSTLLRILAGIEPFDGGQVSLARNVIVTYVSQHAEFETSHTLWDALLENFAPAIQAQARMRVIEAQMASGETEELRKEYRRVSVIAEHGGFDYESRIERVLTGLELDRDQWRRPVSQLSGGQKTRANLARALLTESDLLLLDEPTNHLDIAAIEWLEKYLIGQRQAFIVVAHDRYFLQSVSKRTLELSRGRIEDYPASYVGFLKLRQERRQRSIEQYERQQEHIAATEEFVRRFGAGQRSKEAKGRQKRLDRVERLERPAEERKLRLRLEKSRRSGDTILRLTRLAAGYGSHVVVQGPDELVVPHGARVAIVGPNGSGKTTLARTLIGELPPVSGRFSWAPGSSPSYYAQSTSTVFSADETVLQAFEDRFAVGEETARTYLGRFLFAGEEVLKIVGDLSGGEQSRLALAALLYSHPNVMLLDEPTNHLDIAAREALEQALGDFGGSLVLISHDRFLIDRLATEIWSIENGRIAIYDGGWADFAAGRYRRNLEYSRAAPQSPRAAIEANGSPAAAPVPLSTDPSELQLPPSRDPSDVVAELGATQTFLAQLLKRGETAAATASVEQLASEIEQYGSFYQELARLTDELIKTRTE